ncbi:hypothetical protein CMV_017653 [Castanea mollissima]|uniref:Secreted protein n=1 Tax=Castanea mollissima TaxID=60419 RepID=A0A8J4R450_9ROSI|nr:hypothetical protein CMV_017653 [Castanea mollissima]
MDQGWLVFCSRLLRDVTFFFVVAAPIAETSVQTKYISELVSDLPIVSTFWACDRNVRGTPPISSIPLSALGVLDGDGLYVPLL